ncbi:MAG: hypothetical protein GXO63_02400 [Candidatus Micrarchaeota archaeon]|nr:hypothetical protein [Candidatus Micrarchaeota archaeon]
MEYEKLQKKYNLPSKKWLVENFSFREEEGLPPLLQAKKDIKEKLSDVSAIIEPLIGGVESYRSYIERTMLSASEKKTLFEIYKKIQSLLWEAEILTIKFSERECAEWIKKVRNFWEESSPLMTEIFRNLSVKWQKYRRKNEKTVYHG